MRLRASALAAAVLAAVVAWPAVAVAQDSGADAGAGSGSGSGSGGGAVRVGCEDAPPVFELLCLSYETIKQDYVDEVADEDLALAAAAGVREAGLAPRHVEAAPVCALPAPAFEQACAEIDAVADTAFAVWAASDAMFASLEDPNTFLMTPSAYEESRARLSRGAPFSGIGLRLGLLDGTVGCSQLSETCRLVASEVFPGSPAEQAGLKADDIVVSLNGFVPSGSGCGLQGMSALESGSVVPVIVERSGQRRSFRMVAGPIHAPAVGGRIVAGTTGYLRVGSFGSNTDLRLAEELEALLEAGAETLVVDLRDNPGGYLRTVINIASVFLHNRQVVMREASRDGPVRHLVSRERGPQSPTLLPVALAVDGRSASASEVMALALRHHGRATVVGETTFGKNTGQVTRAVESRAGTLLGGIRVTVFRWSGPGGTSAAGGVEPDVEVDLSGCMHSMAVARRVAAAAGLPGALPADIQMDGEPFEAVAGLAGGGVLDGTGCEPGLFCGGDPVPRWVMAAWLVRVLDGEDPAPISESRFADVDAGRWWAAHADRLAELGITLGCATAPDRYCPDEPVTRAQMASMLTRAFQLDPAGPAGFADTDGSGHAAAIDALAGAGISRGCSSEPRLFCPDQATSRAQMAVFLERALRLGDP